ncbi:GNAT family N-acetyltransferase [Paracoccus zhejiangensis]|uniref:GNAT family N-acetyltransferase n=1 Tax=Paracoccus zhejiangensis TaxID=1077935 RepID=A0A2H5F2P9_9RHOB|nr:GNAT family N-acetyltransferase [Paracoccus zhejiangensis]AUH65821.1 GNAT family N-acetyltransferase [Paracoccus zhejiangensis]
MSAPTLTTGRLTLRPHDMTDFPAYSAVMQSDRAIHMGGPYDLAHAWMWFASDVAQWPLKGCGALAVTETATGRLVGQVILNDLPHYPEREIGWLAFDEGQGYLTEAAARLRDYAFDDLGWPTLVSYIDADNSRSIALARRLGAQLDAAAARPGPEDLVFRHARTVA